MPSHFFIDFSDFLVRPMVGRLTMGDCYSPGATKLEVFSCSFELAVAVVDGGCLASKPAKVIQWSATTYSFLTYWQPFHNHYLLRHMIRFTVGAAGYPCSYFNLLINSNYQPCHSLQDYFRCWATFPAKETFLAKSRSLAKSTSLAKATSPAMVTINHSQHSDLKPDY